ncbi:stage II sporulation protein D [Dendrosporobacter sp. 1207_IL3150]|uniref:stage II sporulation protein D n=1 Tax=Dendrosporobacter sp. 1207_IL3150 TaxID=3084054 RepID=UPI002FD95758
MKKILAFSIALVIIMVILVPVAVVGLDLSGAKSERGASKKVKNEDVPIHVYLHEQDRIVTMSLEEYVKGVVAAEMPAEFDQEALKAQALAARTYAVKNMLVFGGSGLADKPGADVSTDHRVSQAWSDEVSLKTKWGPFKYEQYWKKISQAVEATSGEVITYNGEPINALFHSTSGEKTASSKEVWGFDYPYLQSVACKWDQGSPRYTETKQLALSDIEQRLGADAGVVAAAKSGDTSLVKILELTGSGRVDKVRIGSKTLTGIEMREKLELRSTNFTAELKGDKLIFKTIGYGHGVGLCQYGANGMAKEGRDYRQIITYYYTGVAIKNIFNS